VKKSGLKITALTICACTLLSGCNHAVLGLPGLFMEAVEVAEELTEESLYYDYDDDYEDADIWTWPDTDDHDDTFDWDDSDHTNPDAEPGTVTIMVYMNGSTLETEAGVASVDISEMIKAGYSDDVNVVIQTMGTKYWSEKLGIASDRSQTYVIGEDGLELVRDDMGQLDCTKADTLYEFIQYCSKAYPASRNILILWDHGGGPAYGFGWDEFQADYENLSVDEMKKALRNCDVHFDFIGMDCCIMSCLEITYALRDYCDYMILSEDFESSLGWYYTGWMEALYDNPSISTYDLGKILIDDMIKKNENDRFNGDRSILALVDESNMDKLWDIWVDFAYENEKALLSTNFSQQMEETGKGIGLSARRAQYHSRLSDLYDLFFDDSEIWDVLENISSDDVYMSDYCITDLMGLAHFIDSDKSEKLIKAVDKSLLYVGATKDNLSLTGISVTLPYNDPDLYYELAYVLDRSGYDEDYIEWLKKFCDTDDDRESFDWSGWGENFWNEWGEYEGSDIWGEW